MSVPDRPRPRLALPTPGWRRHGAAAVWRVLHPGSREPYVEAPAPPPAPRVHARTDDGWELPIFRLDPRPAAAAEPVLLATGAGVGPDALRYGRSALVAALVDAGFSPWLATFRTGREASAPAGVRATLEDVVCRDVPALLETVADRSGFPRVHLVAHGLAGVVALAAAARRPAPLATVSALGAPLRFTPATTGLRAASWLARLLPDDAAVPLRSLARLGVWVDPELMGLASVSPARVRGAVRCAAEDVPMPWLRTVLRWSADGVASLHDGLVEVADTLPDARVPLFVATAEADPLCPPALGEEVLARWGHPDAAAVRVAGTHLDLVLGDAVQAPLVAWLTARRRVAWAASAA